MTNREPRKRQRKGEQERRNGKETPILCRSKDKRRTLAGEEKAGVWSGKAGCGRVKYQRLPGHDKQERTPTPPTQPGRPRIHPCLSCLSFRALGRTGAAGTRARALRESCNGRVGRWVAANDGEVAVLRLVCELRPYYAARSVQDLGERARLVGPFPFQSSQDPPKPGWSPHSGVRRVGSSLWRAAVSLWSLDQRRLDPVHRIETGDMYRRPFLGP